MHIDMRRVPALDEAEMHRVAGGRVRGVAGQVRGVAGRVRGVAGQVRGVAGRVHGVAGQVRGVARRVHGVAGHAIVGTSRCVWGHRAGADGDLDCAVRRVAVQCSHQPGLV